MNERVNEYNLCQLSLPPLTLPACPPARLPACPPVCLRPFGSRVPFFQFFFDKSSCLRVFRTSSPLIVVLYLVCQPMITAWRSAPIIGATGNRRPYLVDISRGAKETARFRRLRLVRTATSNRDHHHSLRRAHRDFIKARTSRLSRVTAVIECTLIEGIRGCNLRDTRRSSFVIGAGNMANYRYIERYLVSRMSHYRVALAHANIRTHVYENKINLKARD